MKRALLALSVAALCASARAQDAPEAAVDATVKAFVEQRGVASAAVAVVKDGKPVLSRAWGHADLEHSVPARPDHLYEIGSITKQFTAALALMLAEEGKLDLDAPSERYLPDLPAAWKPVTMRRLLNHTGGLPNYTAQKGFDWERSLGRDDVLNLVKDLPLDFAPGERMSYSNTGYYLAGLILEKIAGKPYGDLLAERIFRPAGMSTARLSTREVIPNRAHGYRLDGGKQANAPMVLDGTAGAAGAILASAQDMAKWEAALQGRRLLKPESYAAMWKPTAPNGGGTSEYALGWLASEKDGRRIQAHSGGTAGFTSNITRVEPDGITVIVLASSGMGAADAIAREVLGHYVPALKPAPPAPAAEKDPDPDRTGRVKAKVLSLLSEKPDLGGLSDDMRKALTPQLLTGMRAQINALGPLNAFTFLSASDSPAGKTYLYRAAFGPVPLIVSATYDDKETIVGLFMRPE